MINIYIIVHDCVFGTYRFAELASPVGLASSSLLSSSSCGNGFSLNVVSDEGGREGGREGER